MFVDTTTGQRFHKLRVFGYRFVRRPQRLVRVMDRHFVFPPGLKIRVITHGGSERDHVIPTFDPWHNQHGCSPVRGRVVKGSELCVHDGMLTARAANSADGGFVDPVVHIPVHGIHAPPRRQCRHTARQVAVLFILLAVVVVVGPRVPQVQVVPKFVRQVRRKLLTDPTFAVSLPASQKPKAPKCAGANADPWQVVRLVHEIVWVYAHLLCGCVGFGRKLPKRASCCRVPEAIQMCSPLHFYCDDLSLVAHLFKLDSAVTSFLVHRSNVLFARPHIALDAVLVAVDWRVAIIFNPNQNDRMFADRSFSTFPVTEGYPELFGQVRV